MMLLESSDLIEVLADPKSVVVVGASANQERLSSRPVAYLREYGFGGALFAVNPRVDLPGVRTVRALRDLDFGSVDVALVALPAEKVVAALRDAEAIGVRAAVVIGSGFEDREGTNRKEFEAFAALSQMRIIGPNCVGALGVPAAAYLTFSSVLQREVPGVGGVGLVTQSGALGNSILQTLIRRHVGLHQWISTGNEIDCGAIECAVGLLSSASVTAVGMFLEGVTDLRWLGRLDKVLRTSGKPLFVLKAAQSANGRQAAAGHTGRVVGSADASDAILRETGVRLVGSVTELADALVVADASPALLHTSHPAIAIVSVSGAAGVIGADRVAQDPRVRLARLDSTSVNLDGRLTVGNPLDVPFVNETDSFVDAVIATASAPDVDVVVAVESSLAHDRDALVAALVSAPHSAPIIVSSLSEDDQIPVALTASMSAAGIAYLPLVERAIGAVAACSAPDLSDANDSFDSHAAKGQRHHGEFAGLESLSLRLPKELPWVGWKVLDAGRSPESIGAAVTELGLPLVVKASGRTIEHRTELHAVQVVTDGAEVIDVIDRIGAVCDAHGDVVMLQALADAGFEVMVSIIDDPEYGPVGFVRPGGTLTELIRSQVILWHGWEPERRRRILGDSQVGRLLGGYRGGTEYDIDALATIIDDCLAAVAAGDVDFLEMNPVLIHRRGASIVDAVGRFNTCASAPAAVAVALD